MKKQDEARACALKTSIGGQALMEGIMMRGPQVTAMAVRNTKGEIVVEKFPTVTAKKEKTGKKGMRVNGETRVGNFETTTSPTPSFFRRCPIIRGIFNYIDSMKLGYKCLMRSAELSGLEDIVEESPKKKKQREAAEKQAAETEQTACAEPSEVPAAEAVDVEATATETPAKENKDEEKLPSWVMSVMMAASVVLAFALALGLFLYAPAKLYELLASHVGFLTSENIVLNSLWKSIFEGVLRILLLVGYMGAITLMKDIRRTFMYHGAEHKTIFCYEAGLELTVENVKKQRRFHPRCGTSFLILMLLVSIFISFFIDPIAIAITGTTLPTVWRVLVKLLLLPLIVGIGYELIKFAGRHDNLFTRIISAPGVLLQHITVFEPTDDMIECAISAVKEVIPDDGSDKW